MERLVGDGGISIPVYGEESEAEALRSFIADNGRKLETTHIRFARVPAGMSRSAAKQSGLHDLYCLGLSDMAGVLRLIDGKTRGIPTTSRIDR
jgi:hypothetical protein